MMLDFIEHVPRAELVEILTALRPCMSASAVVVVNTPDFFVDNDVVTEGLNELGRDSSDFVAETQGMHCNRYTLDSLRQFFAGLGYLAVSRGHYFVLATTPQNNWLGELSYRQLWNEARDRGCRLAGAWPRESFEVPYPVAETPELKTFGEGNLSGVSLYVTKSYEEYYRNGNYDDFLSEYLTRFDLSGQTVFDIGAFVGANTLQFSRMVGEGGLVCSFEPNPFNRDRLRLNLSENPHLDERVRVFPFAVSDQEGQINFRLHRNVDAGISSASYIDGAHTTMTDVELSNFGFTDVSVDVCTIDEFVERTAFSPKCIKLDIEGAEHLALFGAAKTLATHRPILLIELHSTFCAATVINTLAKFGYTSEVLFVEPDGRCFIGSNSAAPIDAKPETGVLQLKFDTLRAEMAHIRRKSEADAARLSASTQECSSLKLELAGANDRVRELEVQQLDLQRRFNEQQVILASVQANLLRYQLFPIIRLARKIKRIFSGS
ncbi:hypothetical protein AC731_013155 [Thauera humireducens]|uniref:Methyltransferase FkbM domain-containing protein n=2 Tax=Thauera humireducens TaxID=1134435 RepID=A0A127K763_9RHOO|nr:hypothetical protein AC731_013155 [Thauera humireducens]